MTSGLSEFTGPNDFYRPPKVYHKKFDKNQKPVGLFTGLTSNSLAPVFGPVGFHEDCPMYCKKII
jgi:hypothetical protein